MARRRWSTRSFLEAGAEGKIVIRNRNVVKVAGGQLVVMGRNVTIAILDPDGKDRTTHRVTYGAKLRVDDGDDVKRGQRIAEWDPYTRPVLAEVDGEVAFEDLVDGVVGRGNHRRDDRLHQARRHRLAHQPARPTA